MQIVLKFNNSVVRQIECDKKADDEITIGKHILMIDIENFQKKSKTWSSGQTDRTYKISAFPRK
jgi:hypothetical protein